MISEELKMLVAERKARHTAELEGLQRSRAEATYQSELQKLQAEHAEARHETAIKLQRQRHQNRMAKQRLLHENAMALERLRKTYPLELKAAREKEAREKRTRERILEAVYQMLVASAETEKKLFFTAFGIQDDA